MKLEVIAKNLKDIYQINKSSADRIEFCKNLEVGGLTPAKWKIWWAAKISKIPVQVMLRPSAESFNYSETDFNKMKKTAIFLEKVHNVHGVVLGILNDKNEIDVLRTKELVNLMPSKQKTFHKAFDEISDFSKGIETLAKLKIDHVLTAAGKDINQNLAELKKITNLKKVIILAGGGVNFTNVLTIANVVNEIHVGTAVRENENWVGKIDIAKINSLKQMIEGKTDARKSA